MYKIINNILFVNSIALDDIATRDSKTRNIEKDVEKLKHDFEMSEHARESAVNENRYDMIFLLHPSYIAVIYRTKRPIIITAFKHLY